MVPILWESHIYNLTFIMNVQYMIKSSRTAFMVRVLWEAHAYNPALMEHEMGKANACNQTLLMLVLWRCTLVTHH